MSDTTENMMSNNDMIFQNVNGTRYTGDYKIHNVFKDNNVGPYSYIQQGGSSEILMSSLFENLAVPTGLLFLQQTYPSKHKGPLETTNKEISVIKDHLYDTLLDLVGANKKSKKENNIKNTKKKSKRNTRKARKQTNKKSSKIR